MELPPPAPDGLVYVTTVTAAALLNIAPVTVTSWKAKGYLKPVPGSPPRKPLYRWLDVLDAEYVARMNALRTNRTSRTSKHVRRDRQPAGGARRDRDAA